MYVCMYVFLPIPMYASFCIVVRTLTLVLAFVRLINVIAAFEIFSILDKGLDQLIHVAAEVSFIPAKQDPNTLNCRRNVLSMEICSIVAWGSASAHPLRDKCHNSIP